METNAPEKLNGPLPGESPEVRDANALTKYHQPTEEQIAQMAKVRSVASLFIIEIARNCPKNADRSAAIRKVREALMTANASIVLPPISL